jgi:hypothetical protein
MMNERFIIDHYDEQYVTNDVNLVFQKISELERKCEIIKHLKVKNFITDEYDIYYVYHTGNNHYIDSKIKSQYTDLTILPIDKYLFFFKLTNDKTDCDVKISDILPKGVDINQYTIQYYHLLNNIEKILSKSEIHELFDEK